MGHAMRKLGWEKPQKAPFEGQQTSGHVKGTPDERERGLIYAEGNPMTGVVSVSYSKELDLPLDFCPITDIPSGGPVPSQRIVHGSRSMAMVKEI